MTTGSPHHRRSPLIPLVGLLAAAAACGGSTPTAAPAPTPPDDVTANAVVVDLASRTLDLDTGDWTVAFCEGEAPFICVSDGPDHIGVVEYAQWPLTSGVAADTLANGGTTADALTDHARDFLTAMQADRSIGCGDDYHLTASEPTSASVAGQDGIRYGFTADLDGRTVETVIIHATITGRTLTTFTAAGYEPDGCLPREGEFSVADLETFTPTLSRLVAAARLPTPTTAVHPDAPAAEVADGTHHARLTAIDDPYLAVELLEVLSGAEAVAAARADGIPGVEDRLPNDVYVRPLDPDRQRQVRYLIEIAPDATVERYDCTQGCRTVAVPLVDFLDGTTRPHDGDQPLVTIELTGGRITHLGEQYVP
jgi:hypothetical protein